MPHGSLYLELEDAQPIGRARLLNLYSHTYPGLEMGRWYPVRPVWRLPRPGGPASVRLR